MKLFWTEDILTEVLYHRRKKNPHISGGQQRRLRMLLEASMLGGSIDDFDVATAYPFEDLLDRHVDAAARACSADYLVTSDSGFTSGTVDLDVLPYEVYSPDQYLEMVREYLPDQVARVTLKQDDYWKRKLGTEYSSSSLYDQLQRCQCPQFAESVREILVRTPVAI